MERTEHPKPQFERENWLNLNGEWEFEFDLETAAKNADNIGKTRFFIKKSTYPFAPKASFRE